MRASTSCTSEPLGIAGKAFFPVWDSLCSEPSEVALRADNAARYPVTYAPCVAVRDSGVEELSYELASGRSAWIQVIRGEVTLNGESVRAGDGGAIEEESSGRIHGGQDSEVLVFDLK